VTNEFYFSDWLFLYYLAKNMEPYLFRQLIIDYIIPEIKSESNSMIFPETSEFESDKLKESETETSDNEDNNLDNHSLNSDDMAVVPSSRLAAVNEKRVKFA
jgi:hypothetical protein